MAKSVVRLDNVKAVYTGNIFSVKTAAVLENGFVGKLGANDPVERDVYALEAPVAADKVVLIANPAMIYDNARLGSGLENQYQMEIDEIVRAYELEARDKVGISREGIVTIAVGGAAVAGNYIVVADGTYKLKEITVAAYDALVTKPAFAAKVIREDAVGGALSINTTQTPTTYVVIEVVQN
ncbi:MAG TPA: hypothetical protein VI423_10175 [Paenisporosarcina sp.]|nr:hypothetical protein [Paenisporosarcina sp.]